MRIDVPLCHADTVWSTFTKHSKTKKERHNFRPFARLLSCIVQLFVMTSFGRYAVLFFFPQKMFFYCNKWLNADYYLKIEKRPPPPPPTPPPRHISFIIFYAHAPICHNTHINKGIFSFVIWQHNAVKCIGFKSNYKPRSAPRVIIQYNKSGVW